MAGKPLFTPASLRELIEFDEGQFLELKGTWSYERAEPQPIGKTKLRSMVAEYVAAFANADGGTLVIGVEDNGEVTGHGRTPAEVEDLVAIPERRLQPPHRCDHQLIALDGHEVLVIQVKRAVRAVMVGGDGFPYRIADTVTAQSEEWINALKRAYDESGFEQRLANAGPADLDIALLPAAASDQAWLSDHGLVVPRSGTAAVTNAAVLLAGRPPAVRWHQSSTVRVFRVDGTERKHGAVRNVTQIERIDGPVTELIPAAHAAVRGQIRRSEKLHDLFFREIPEYPDFAWQEAIVNAVAHRDYADHARGVEVWLYEDRLEVKSPGAPIAPVTVEEMQQGLGIHASRNPLISRVLVELGLMREEGEGIPRMFGEMERSFLHPPEFRVEHETTIVTLRNTPIFETADPAWQRVVERLTTNDAHRRVLLLHPQGFTNEQYREVNGVDRDEAYRQIQEMVSGGIVLAPDSKGRGANYRLSPEAIEARTWLDLRLPELRRFFGEHEKMTNTDYRDLFGVTRFMATDELRRLVEFGALAMHGRRRGAYYVPGMRLDG